MVQESAAVAVLFVPWRLYRTARKAASTLGHVEVDKERVRWHREDGALVFNAAWQQVERATIDLRTCTSVLFRTDRAPYPQNATPNE